MTALRRWSGHREREAIVRHLARCSFCRALLTYSRRRSDRALLDAADRLAGEHVTNDAERQAFTQPWKPAQGRPPWCRGPDAAACETGS
jgi:hypothetical protein